YRVLQDIMNAGALGAEVVLSGKIPSARARSWRFSTGYMKKSGEIALYKVKKATIGVNLKAGTIGVKVSIMTPDIELPDKMLAMKTQEVKLIPGEKKIEVTVTDAADSEPAVAPAEVPAEKPAEEKKKKEQKKRAPRKTKMEKKDVPDQKK
ncbi:hypothetical protein HYS50_01035, partial [Candidatus Woesearchaeota archaeon]|nr:hypothetical protein [Candidatus Woesearchaeota archaeon]